MTVPSATYRLQLHADFTLNDAAALVPYLARLGISHVYLSPIAEARAGSAHGYDVVEPCCVSEALGGPAALAALSGRLREHQMGVLLDIVPNHMAASTENPWWRDLLERGPASEHVRTFDTPWMESPDGPLQLPILGDPLDEVLARGELAIGERHGSPVLTYFERWLPIPGTAYALADRARESPDEIRTLLDALPYELAHWKHVASQVCYRRFFDITDLIGVRVEDPEVFARTHAGILEWLRNGWIDGLRIDHIDGLRDPEGYLEQLAAATGRARDGSRCYTVVEKILAVDERIPSSWVTDGATGYEFARLVSSFLVFPPGYSRLDALRARWTDEHRDFAAFTLDRKRFVLDRLFCAELADVARRIADLGNLPVDDVRAALRELTVALSVYRTYISERGVSGEDRRRIDAAREVAAGSLPKELRATLDEVCAIILLERTHAAESAVAATVDAVARWQQLTGPVMAKGFEDTVLYSWPALLAMNEVGGEPGEALPVPGLHTALQTRAEETPFALNATSTHDTKRSEDVRARLLVLAEHADEMAGLGEHWRAFLAKAQVQIAPRDEIVLLQTLVGVWPLSGVVDETLAARVREFMRKAAREAKVETSWREPDSDYEERLDRAVDHVLLAEDAGAIRQAVHAMVERIGLHGACNGLNQVLLKCTAPGVPDVYQGTEDWRLDLVDPDNRRPVDYTVLESRAAELEPLVAAPDAEHVGALLQSWRDGRIKQYVLMATLACRARNAAFLGRYRPAVGQGERARNVIAFERASADQRALVIATRWPAGMSPAGTAPLGDLWEDTVVAAPAGVTAWRSALTGERFEVVEGTLALRSILRVLPCALLEPA